MPTTKEHQLSQPFEKLIRNILSVPAESKQQSVPCVTNLIIHVKWTTMRFMYTVDAIPVLEQDFSLHLMINRLILSTMSQASRQQCIISNKIQPGFFVEADEKKLLAVTGNLLNAVIAHSKNCSLAISAKQIGHVILLHVKVNSRLYSRPFAEKLAGVQEMAIKAGASVSVTSFRNNITTLAIGFMSHNTVN